MDRERWQSYPIQGPEDRLFLALLAVVGHEDELTVTAESETGVTRPIRVRRSVHVEEPVPGAEATGQVVCRIEFEGDRPRPDETIHENLWLLATERLDRVEAEARRLLGTAVGVPSDEKPHGFEYIIDVTHEDAVYRYGIPRLSASAPTTPGTPAVPAGPEPPAPDPRTKKIALETKTPSAADRARTEKVEPKKVARKRAPAKATSRTKR